MRGVGPWVMLVLACGQDLTHLENVISSAPAMPAELHPGPRSTGAMGDIDESSLGVASRPVQSSQTCPVEPCFGAKALQRFDARDPYRQQISVRGDTALAPPLRAVAECASQGPELIYNLDLRAFDEPVRAYLEVRGTFDASLRIEEGPLEDPFLVTCNEDHAPGVTEAFLSVELEPKQYRLVVDGETASDAGEFELVVELPPKDGRCGVAPSNDRCERAIAIDTELPVQTFFGTTECASDQAQPLWECGDFFERQGEVFYSLDLSRRSSPVMFHATTELAPTNHEMNLYIMRDVAGECTKTLICNDLYETRLWARLDPGRYFLGVERAGAAGDFGLRVEIPGEPCTVANDTCRTAEPIEPRLGAQNLVVWPGCGDDSIDTSCGGSSPDPDIFYQLDLRGFQGLVHVRAKAERESLDFAYLTLMTEAAGDCGEELWCGNFDLWLEPKSYLLALDGFRDQQGPVTLTLEIDQAPPPGPADCIDESIALCAVARDRWCCAGDGELCWLAFISCGLRVEALDCLCETNPTCCSGAGYSEECGRLLKECGTFCPGFDSALACPG